MASIIHRLTTRSITGHGLGIDVHKHDEDLLLLSWKQKGYERCYTHFLERRFLELSEFTMLKNYIYHSGFPNTLACMSSWLPGKWDFPPCPFLTSGPTRHILYFPYRLSVRSTPDSPYCECTKIFMSSNKANTSVSIFCINRHRKFTSKIPHSAQQWLWSRHELDPASRTLHL